MKLLGIFAVYVKENSIVFNRSYKKNLPCYVSCRLQCYLRSINRNHQQCGDLLFYDYLKLFGDIISYRLYES